MIDNGEQQFLDDIIEERIDAKKLYWADISQNYHLSEYFIEKFKYYVDWHLISKCQKLSERFIWEMKGKVHWPYIFEYQTLSKGFVEQAKLYLLSEQWAINVYGRDYLMSIGNITNDNFISPEKDGFQFLEIEK